MWSELLSNSNLVLIVIYLCALWCNDIDLILFKSWIKNELLLLNKFEDFSFKELNWKFMIICVIRSTYYKNYDLYSNMLCNNKIKFYVLPKLYN